MATFRVMVEGEGVKPDERALGFFTTRQVVAESSAEAREIAVAETRADWLTGRSAVLGRLDDAWAVHDWPVRWPWLHRPAGGHTLHDRDQEARETAWRIEVGAARPPRSLTMPE